MVRARIDDHRCRHQAMHDCIGADGKFSVADRRLLSKGDYAGFRHLVGDV